MFFFVSKVSKNSNSVFPEVQKRICAGLYSIGTLFSRQIKKNYDFALKERVPK